MKDRPFQGPYGSAPYPLEGTLPAGDTDAQVPGTPLTLEEFEAAQRLGRRLQARAMASALTGLLRTLAWPFTRLAAGYMRASREAAAIRQLNALNDHLLADLGIRRSEIPAAVAGLVRRPAAAPTLSRVRAAPVRVEPAAPGNDPEAKAAA